MDHNEDKDLIDPDYLHTNKALRLKEVKEKEESKLTAEKINNAVVEIFDEELSSRQKQLEEVEEKIFKAQKLLHLVRYVLITSYYKKNDLEVSADEEVTTAGFDKQNRIHPAVKKLLGSNPRLDIFCAGKGKRRLASKSCDKEASSSQTAEPKRPRLEIKSELQTSHLSKNSEQIYSKNRKKIRHRIVVGNVSKWVPSLEDSTTHKWMMYVRGDKDSADISHIIERVIFYLHPSYKPHDVVEIKESPFHLSRRGWGEFPLRVQMFFKCPLNKPISIVHNLKLEKTFTGRQTLGNETVVDVYLHDNVPKPETITRPQEDSPSTSWWGSKVYENSPSTSYNNIFNNFDSTMNQSNHLESDYTPLDDTVLVKSEPRDDYSDMQIKLEIKLEPVEIILPVSKSDLAYSDSDQIATNVDLISTRSDSAYGCSDTASMSFEHDYCDVVEEQFVDNEIEVKEDLFLNQFLLEHSYSVLSGTEIPESSCENMTKSHSVIVNGDVDNKLIFGLGLNYLKEKIVNVHNVVPKNMTVLQKPLENSRLYFINGVESSDFLLSNAIVTLPKNKFKNVGEALPFLLNRFKLWNKKVENPRFKLLYPFIASSQEEFGKWPLGKQLNSEWNRAREIKKILDASFPTLNKKWSTRACFMYARSHKYDACASTLSGRFFKNPSEDRTLIDECFQHSIIDSIKIEPIDAEVDVDVEADENESVQSIKSNCIDISDVRLKNNCSFIKEASLNCGVVLRSEEISDGVIMNGAERMILEAVKCLAGGLIRRANHHLVCKEDYREGLSEVTTEEVKIALKERSELQLIKIFQKKKREIEYFS